MDNVKIFEGKEVEVFEFNGKVLFNPYDVGRCLELTDSSTRNHLQKMNDNQRIKLTQSIVLNKDNLDIPTSGKVYLTESGVYKLIFKSRKKEAERFSNWVTDEVLPSIRKNGMYATDDLLDNPDLMIKIVTKLKEEREERKRLELINRQNEHKVLFADSVISSNDSVSVGTLAKLICQNGYEIGQNRLFDWLRANDYLMKNGERKNQPRQEYVERGFFTVSEKCFTDTYGNTRLGIQTRITPRGQLYFINKFLGKENNLYAEVCSIGS